MTAFLSDIIAIAQFFAAWLVLATLGGICFGKWIARARYSFPSPDGSQAGDAPKGRTGHPFNKTV